MTAPTALAGLIAVPLGILDPDPANPRSHVGDVADLTETIRALGILQPIIVKQVGNRYQVIEGHRRRQAAMSLGMTALPAIVKNPTDRTQQLAVQLAIDTTRVKLDPVDEAEACHRLFTGGMGRHAIASAIGRSPAWVAGRLGLVILPPEAKAALRAGTLTVANALLLVQQIRAERDSSPQPATNQREYRAAPAGSTPAKTTTGRRRPASLSDTKTREPSAAWVHFVRAHPLAADARRRCEADHQDTTPKLGGVACGPCWEAAIRADALAQAVA